MPELTRTDDVFVLHLGEGDIRFTPAFDAAMAAILDELERTTGPAALVTTATGKIWHNGLDLEHLAALGDGFVGYVGEVQELFARFLLLPMPTVAAVQGHAFAGGAMLALCHDVRVMRADRGYVCLPEIDLGMPFSDGMAALIAAKVAQPARHRLAVLGERIGGRAATGLGIADEAVDGEEAVPEAALARAATLAPKASPAITALRRNFYGPVVESLRRLGT